MPKRRAAKRKPALPTWEELARYSPLARLNLQQATGGEADRPVMRHPRVISPREWAESPQGQDAIRRGVWKPRFKVKSESAPTPRRR